MSAPASITDTPQIAGIPYKETRRLVCNRSVPLDVPLFGR
jgi:hypothetical protein